MYKKILFFIALIILLLVVVVSYTNTTKIEEDSSDSLTKILEKENNSVALPMKKIKNTLSKLRKTSLEQKKRSPQRIDIYESLSLEEAQLTSKARKNIQPITAIQMNPQAFKQLNIQDIIVLPDIEGVDYPLTVTHVQKNTDGSITTTSSYTDEGISYTTTMTQSNDESFISLATAQGLYEIETNNGIGYVYKTEDIRKRMQKSSLNDVIILPIPNKNLIKK